MVLSLLLGPANRPDQELFEAVLDDIPPVATPAGGRCRRPDKCHADKCHADKGYDYRHCRSYLTRRGIKIRIARRGVESSERLGRHRWKAERTIAWLFGCRRLRIRYDRASERFYAFGLLACSRLSFNRYTDPTARPAPAGLVATGRARPAWPVVAGCPAAACQRADRDGGAGPDQHPQRGGDAGSGQARRPWQIRTAQRRRLRQSRIRTITHTTQPSTSGMSS